MVIINALINQKTNELLRNARMRMTSLHENSLWTGNLRA